MRSTRFDRPIALSLLLWIALLGVACGGEKDAPAPEPATPAPPVADAATPAPLPEGIGPIASSGEKITAPVLGETVTGAGITYQFPEGWRQVPPSSSMRLDQAVIPGDAGDGELTVFFFGPGGGGGVEPNLQRWAGQIASNAAPQREVFTLDNGLRVTWIEAAGTLKASTMGTGPTADQPNFRLFAAVVEGPGGPWFFKATGPDATMLGQRDDFLALLGSMRLASPSA